MSEETQRASRKKLAHVFSEASLQDWDSLLRHFDLGSGFALMLLCVSSAEAARQCRDALKESLAPASLLELDATTPDALYALPSRLLTEALPDGTGAVWVMAGWDPEERTRLAIQTAWEDAARRLNQHRDTLRRQLSVPLVVVGAAELPILLREQAPDLWSVRTLQITMQALDHLEPGRWRQDPRGLVFFPGLAEPTTQYTQLAKLVGTDALSPSERASLPLWPVGWQGRGEEDPLSLLSEAALVRGQPGESERLAEILQRAAYSFARRHMSSDLTHCLGELSSLPDPPAARAWELKLLRAFLALLQRDAAGAEAAVVGPIAFSVEPPVEIRSVACELACYACLLQGDLPSARTSMELLQGLSEPLHASLDARWRREYADGLSFNELGRFVEAEQALRRALVFVRQIAARSRAGRWAWPALATGLSRRHLAWAIGKQDRWPAAEEHARQAIAELECGGEDGEGQARAWIDLAAALENQRRLPEAIEALHQAQRRLPAEDLEGTQDVDQTSLRSAIQGSLNKLEHRQAAAGNSR